MVQQQDKATMSKHDQEFYEVSARFYLAMQTKALSLEENAQHDELIVSTLEHFGHVQRQQRLVCAQRNQAKRLRQFLANARVRGS